MRRATTILAFIAVLLALAVQSAVARTVWCSYFGLTPGGFDYLAKCTLSPYSPRVGVISYDWIVKDQYGRVIQTMSGGPKFTPHYTATGKYRVEVRSIRTNENELIAPPNKTIGGDYAGINDIVTAADLHQSPAVRSKPVSAAPKQQAQKHAPAPNTAPPVDGDL